VELLLWVVFGVIPAVAAMLIGVGVGGPRWLAPALAVAICVPAGMAHGWPGWPWQLDAHHGAPRPWLWWLLATAGLLGGAYDLRALPKALALIGEIALLAFLPWLLSAPLRAGWTFEGCVVILGAGWVVRALIWWVLRGAAKGHPGMSVPLAMTFVLSTDAYLLSRHVGGSHWELAGVAAIALGFAVLTTVWRRPFVCGTGGTLLITLAHVGLLWCGRSERQLLHAHFVLAALAPLPMWAVTMKAFADGRATGALVGVIGVALLCAAAVGLA
jgi:hypothetical protein